MAELFFLLLQAEPSLLNQLMFPALILIVAYFFLVRPQSQKHKAQQKFSEEIAKGSSIVTTSGILGKITKIDGEVVTVEVSPKTYIQVLRSAVSKELTEETYNKDKKDKK
ncbi:MAG: preprotein translocase subunit YajC [Bacteroidota bacterium]